MSNKEEKEKSLSSFILRSKYRKDILFSLLEKPFQTQTQLLSKTSLKYRAHISRTIKELEEQDLIECENPNETMYKLYKPKQKAFKVKEELKRYGQL